MRFSSLVDRLAHELPDAHIVLAFTSELELLVCVLLAAQCTDVRVNEVTPALFQRFRSAADYAAVTAADIEPYLKRLGLFRTKARHLAGLGRALVDHHQGRVPRTREALAALPGVGRKTAGVVAFHAFGTPAFAVDTHVGRLARRLGLTREANPDRVERDLSLLLAPERWGRAHQLLVWHGRRTCTAPAPACGRCSVADLCPRLRTPDPEEGREERG